MARRGKLSGPKGRIEWLRGKQAWCHRPCPHAGASRAPVAVAAFAAECLETHGITVIDAPLSGGTIGAEEGRLSIMVGGPGEVVERLKPLFELYGATVLRFGNAGAGSIAKACNQIVVAATVTALSEAMALAEA